MTELQRLYDELEQFTAREVQGVASFHDSFAQVFDTLTTQPASSRDADMDWADLFGLVATTALTAVMIAAQLADLTRLDLPRPEQCGLGSAWGLNHQSLRPGAPCSCEDPDLRTHEATRCPDNAAPGSVSAGVT